MFAFCKINGKSAGDPALREAVGQLRESGYTIEVRVTWEDGDAARYAAKAVADGVECRSARCSAR